MRNYLHQINTIENYMKGNLYKIKGSDLMRFIIMKELKYYFRRPLFYIGVILVLLCVLFLVKPYLGIEYYGENKKFIEVTEEKQADVEIYDGYIPTDEQERYQLALDNIYEDLLIMGYNKEKAKEAIQKINDTSMSIEQIDEYMRNNYKMHGSTSFFQFRTNYRLGTVTEVNQYIKHKLSIERYTQYWGRKYADYMSIATVFFGMIMFAILCINEYKHDIYEVLHSKPIKPYKFILGKVLGGVIANIIALGVVTFVFDIILTIKCRQSDFPANFCDLWFYFVVCICPVVICMGCFSVFLTSLFKTSLPTIPIFVLWLIYSNLGEYRAGVGYGYVQKPLSIITRFPANFFDTSFSNDIFLFQGILILIAVLMVILSIIMWTRRTLL